MQDEIAAGGRRNLTGFGIEFCERKQTKIEEERERRRIDLTLRLYEPSFRERERAIVPCKRRGGVGGTFHPLRPRSAGAAPMGLAHARSRRAVLARCRLVLAAKSFFSPAKSCTNTKWLKEKHHSSLNSERKWGTDAPLSNTARPSF